ncbi:hypothetical protein GVX82_03075 [Patescibacteria group bacterium]|jgi:hypothetical protein|nr:hypothetical protein [Patescibacteria group bacterium]
MRGDVQKKIQQRYLELPPEIQDMVTDEKTRAYIVELGKRHGVHVDQLGILENELLIIMLGLDTPANLPDHLAARAHIPKETAAEIAQEVDQRLLTPLRSAYQKLFHLDQRRAAGEENPEIAGPGETDLENTSLGNLEANLPDSVFSSGRGGRSHSDATETGTQTEATPPGTTGEPQTSKGALPQEERLAKEGGLRPSERSRDEVREKLPPRPQATGESGAHGAPAASEVATTPQQAPQSAPAASSSSPSAGAGAPPDGHAHAPEEPERASEPAPAATGSPEGAAAPHDPPQASPPNQGSGETAPPTEEPKRPTHTYTQDPYREPVE